MPTSEVIVSGETVDEVYTGIMADVARLARKLANTNPYDLVNGPDALQTFADHLDGIVAAVGVDQSQTVRVSVQTPVAKSRLSSKGAGSSITQGRKLGQRGVDS